MSFFDLWRKKYILQRVIQQIDDNWVAGYLFTPKKGYNGKLIFILHGGFNLSKEEDIESYTDVVWYCEQGFAVFVLKYDKDSVQGMKEATLRNDVREAYDAARIFKQRWPNVKIYLLGASRGSWVAQWTMMWYPNLFDRGAYLVGPTYLPSWFQNIKDRKIFPEVTVGERIGLNLIHPYFCWDFDNEVSSSSTLFFESIKTKPMLLIYGSKDPTVTWQQGELLANACGLTEKKEFWKLEYNHGLAREMETMKLVRDFFNKN